jgi:hypothetical protein
MINTDCVKIYNSKNPMIDHMWDLVTTQSFYEFLNYVLFKVKRQIWNKVWLEVFK